MRPSAAPTTGFTTTPSEKERTVEENFAVAIPTIPDHEPAPALVQEPSPLAATTTPAALVTATNQPTAPIPADHATISAPVDHATLTSISSTSTLTDPSHQGSPKTLTPDELKREKARTLARQELEAGFPASFLATPFTLGLSSTDKILIEAMCQGESNDSLCEKFGLARATLANKFITPFYVRLGVTGTLTGSDYRRQLVVIKAYRERLIEPPAPAEQLELTGLGLNEIELELIRMVAVMGLKRSHLEVMYELPFYTLDRHFKRLYNRLGVDGPYELTCYAYRHSLIEQLPPSPALTLTELLARPEPKPKAQLQKEQAVHTSAAITPVVIPATAPAIATAPAPARRQSKSKPPTPRAATATATATPQPPAPAHPTPNSETLETATSPQVEKAAIAAAPTLSKDQKALAQARQELEEGWPGSYLAASVVAKLTRQEQTFLEGLCAGESTTALVRRLKVSHSALTKKVIAPLYIKLGLHRSYATLESRRQLAVIKAYRLGLVSPNPGERLDLTALGLSRLDIELIRLSAVEGLRRSHIAVKFSQPLYLVDEMLQKLYLKLRVNGSGGLAAYVYRHGLVDQLPPVEGRKLEGADGGETQDITPLPLPGPAAPGYDHATARAGDATGDKAALLMVEPTSASPVPDHPTQHEITTTAAVTTDPTMLMLDSAAEDTKADVPVSNADWEEYHRIARQAAHYYYWVLNGDRAELEQIAAVAAAYAYRELAGAASGAGSDKNSPAPTRREIANTAASEIRRQLKSATSKKAQRIRLDEGGALGLRESEETSPRYASRWVDTEHSFSDLSLGQKLRWGLEEYLDEAS